ncbi:MAG TPA: alpha/beta hydrolase [Candidatus Limnocylindrales bacterium]
MAAPRRAPGEASLGSLIDALGGEVVRIRARDGVRLSARWLSSVGDTGWSPDPHEAIVLLHGWSGSVAPDLAEYAPFLRRTARVLAVDFRGHGDSDEGPTTFGALEVEDVAGALAWLGDRGIRRLALFGTSMGGITAVASVVVLGDGSLPGADAEPFAPAARDAAPRPRIVGVVADSVVGSLDQVLADRVPQLVRGLVARLGFAEVARRVGVDPRATEPIRIIGLVEPVPLLLVHGGSDPRTPARAARALAAAAGPAAEHWIVPGAGHAGSHRADPATYEARVTGFLRRAFTGAREAAPIIAASSGAQVHDPSLATRPTP